MREGPWCKDLRSTYDKICGHFKPAMHHFFLENFPTPQLWQGLTLLHFSATATTTTATTAENNTATTAAITTA